MDMKVTSVELMSPSKKTEEKALEQVRGDQPTAALACEDEIEDEEIKTEIAAEKVKMQGQVSILHVEIQNDTKSLDSSELKVVINAK